MASSWQRDPASRRFRVCCVLFVVCECFSGRLRCFGISDGLGLLILGFIEVWDVWVCLLRGFGFLAGFGGSN